MAYQTLYLRWRPSSFDTLVGQVPVKQALMNALSSGRIAHAYLFTGPRGTGKTTTARIFAKALNCLNGPTDHPCGECLNCRQITDGSAMDVQELDRTSGACGVYPCHNGTAENFANHSFPLSAF